MAIKNVVIPWVSGGALLLGYAAFAWLRGQRVSRRTERGDTLPANEYEVAPFSDRLEHVPEELAFASEAPLPANSNQAPVPRVDRGALFLGRAASALSPFRNQGDRTSTAAGKF
ncbi:MAG: hypothetical protein ABW061_00280 [Polyangiaceae bacterium]